MSVKTELNTLIKDGEGNPLPSGTVKVTVQTKTRPNGVDQQGNPLPFGWADQNIETVASEQKAFQVDAQTRYIVELP